MSIFQELSAPFDPAEISWRAGPKNKENTSALAFAYADARVFMDRLDAVVGPDGWQNKYSHANGKTVCDLGIRYGGEWIWKADGAGDTDNEAEKGALSDAFKRACVRHGIGRYLYEIKGPWVAIEPYGKSFRIKESETTKLLSFIEQHTEFVKFVFYAAEQSDKGIEIYKSFYLGLTDGERKSLKPYHEKYKQNAEFVTNQKKAS